MKTSGGSWWSLWAKSCRPACTVRSVGRWIYRIGLRDFKIHRISLIGMIDRNCNARGGELSTPTHGHSGFAAAGLFKHMNTTGNGASSMRAEYRIHESTSRAQAEVVMPCFRGMGLIKHGSRFVRRIGNLLPATRD